MNNNSHSLLSIERHQLIPFPIREIDSIEEISLFFKKFLSKNKMNLSNNNNQIYEIEGKIGQIVVDPSKIENFRLLEHISWQNLLILNNIQFPKRFEPGVDKYNFLRKIQFINKLIKKLKKI